MDPSNLPSQADLNSLMGAWNPMSYMQGFQNQGLADQFRQQAYAANANQIDKGTLENTQSAAMNPLLVQQQQGVNAGRDITNQSAGLDLASKQGTFQDKQALLHAQIAREMSDEELSKESNNYLKMYQQAKLSGNEDDAMKYGNVLDTLTGAVAAKAADRVQQRNLAELGAISKSQIAAADRASQESIAAGANVSRENVAATNEAARVRAAELHQNIANIIAEEYKKPAASRDQAKIDGLTRVLQTTTPSWAGGVDINQLGAGKGLGANVPASAPSRLPAGVTIKP